MVDTVRQEIAFLCFAVGNQCMAKTILLEVLSQNSADLLALFCGGSGHSSNAKGVIECK